ncbi:MAG: hypothetical protein MSH15_01145 [Oscillospiraceae bacterium]|nr:hypothetical protein [Oscillospiraceae bacterium]
MANTVNLGSVVGPKPALKRISKNQAITGTEDKKGRLFIDSDPLVTGAKYLFIVSPLHTDNFRLLLYAKDTDKIVGSLYFEGDGGSSPNTFQAVLPSPFSYSIQKDVVTQVRLIEDGYVLS